MSRAREEIARGEDTSDAYRGKQVDVAFPVLPELLERWSPRVFSDRRPALEDLATLFEAARLAPSAHNSQPTRFLLARRDHGTTFPRLLDCLDEKNRWAGAAPVLILGSVMTRRFSQHDAAFVPYSHHMHDLGLAVMSMLVQARSVGLYTHPLAAFDPVRAREEFQVPELFEPAIVIAVGFPGDPETAAEDIRERELARRFRRPLADLVFEETWGQSTDLFGQVRRQSSAGEA